MDWLISGRMNDWMDGRTDRRIDGWMDESVVLRN